MSQIFFFRAACLLGGLAILLGAFAAHGLEKHLSPRMLNIFEVGVRYQMYHALALLALSLGSSQLWTSAKTAWAATSWLAGVVLFSGSLYLLALTEFKKIGIITPIGGLLLAGGWFLLLLAVKPTA